MKNKSRIGIIGTGFIANGLRHAIEHQPDMLISRMLTRRNLADLPADGKFTNSVHELLDLSDLIVEAAGDPVYATEMIAQAFSAGLPVVTMDSELQITSGTFLSTLGYLTEAEGDQPGSLAALNRETKAMGFKPLVYGNLKGYLNHNPTLPDMEYWANIQGISLQQVTAFTDGTKLQVEQALVANGLNATIARRGLLGLTTSEVDEGSSRLAAEASRIGQPISDYLLSEPGAPRRLPAGVFITGLHDDFQVPSLKYLKMGEGPYYTLLRNYHLCHLEIPKTIREVLNGLDPLLTNGPKPTVSVVAIPKVRLEAGTRIDHALGSFTIRGEAILINSMPDHLPIGLMKNTVIKHTVEQDQPLRIEDVEIPESLAYQAWRFTLENALS